MYNRRRTGLLLLAGVLLVGGAAAGVAARGAHPVQAQGVNPVGVPLKPNDALIAVETLQGQSMSLNAAVTPVIFFARWCPHCQRDLPRIQRALTRLSGIHKPVVLVSTYFRKPAHAIATTRTFVRREHLTMPVVVQLGPPNLYVRSVPTMIAMIKGHWVTYTGEAAIVKHLAAVATVTVPPTSSKQP